MNIPLQPFYDNKKDKIFVGKEHDFIFYLISKSLLLQKELKYNLHNDTLMWNSTQSWLCYSFKNPLDFSKQASGMVWIL